MSDNKKNEMKAPQQVPFEHPILAEGEVLSEVVMRETIASAVQEHLDELEKTSDSSLYMFPALHIEEKNDFFKTVASWYECQKQNETIETLKRWKEQLWRNSDSIAAGFFLGGGVVVTFALFGMLVSDLHDDYEKRVAEAQKAISHIAKQEQLHRSLYNKDIPLVVQLQRDVWQKYLDGKLPIVALEETMMNFEQTLSPDSKAWTEEQREGHAWLSVSMLNLRQKTQSPQQFVYELYYKLLSFKAQPYPVTHQNPPRESVSSAELVRTN